VGGGGPHVWPGPRAPPESDLLKGLLPLPSSSGLSPPPPNLLHRTGLTAPWTPGLARSASLAMGHMKSSRVNVNGVTLHVQDSQQVLVCFVDEAPLPLTDR